MTTNHIDQLKEWWEKAEQGAPSKGDAIIRRTDRLLSNGYAYEVGTEDYTDAKHLDNVRILSRAPKPKPAWHDAKAVIASTDLCERQVWERDGASGWDGTAGDTATTEELRDVTPLTEAKVTDEMVQNAALTINPDGRWGALPFRDIRAMITAALGLEAR